LYLLKFKTMRQSTKNQIKKGAEEVSEALSRFFSSNVNNLTKRIVAFSFLLLFNVTVTTPGAMNGSLTSVAGIPQMSEEQIYVRSVKNKMKENLVSEVDRYITSMAPNSGLSPELIVEKCVEYETDIIFVLAQGLLESHFGTKGKAAETNSVWNVGTYDNGKILYRYDDPNESLEPYLKLITENYFVNVTEEGDTIYKDISHLTSDRGYINHDGKRFASARGYENAMRKLMITIDTKTSIKFYQGILTLPEAKLLAYFNPNPEILEPENFMALR